MSYLFKKKPLFVFVHLNNGFSGSPMVLSHFVDCAIDDDRINSKLLTNRDFGILSKFRGLTENFDYSFQRNFKLLMLFKWLRVQFEIFRLLVKLSPDVVVVNTIHPFGALLYAIKFNRTSIAYIHENNFANGFLTYLLFKIVERADLKIVVSNSLKRSNKSLIESRVLFNSHQINLRKTRNDRIKKIGLVTNSDFKKKGVEMFFRVALEFPNLQFVLQSGLDKETLEVALSKYSIPNNLIANCRTSKMQNFYYSIDLLLNLSNPKYWVETFGLTIIEAQASGIPVLAPNIGGPIEIVNDGIDGFLVDTTNIGQIKNKISFLTNNTFVYNKFCKSAYSNSKRFDFKSYKKNVTKLIDDVLFRWDCK